MSELTPDQVAKRLRWIMIAVMLFSVILTLCGQPEGYWRHPETAIRGDGLSIDNATNPAFEFFLGRGWQAFLITSLLYLAGVFWFVSLLPGKTALVAIFSFIFGYFFGGSNWLAVRWQLGVQGLSIYGLVLASAVVLSLFPMPGPNVTRIIKTLRWVMVIVMSIDMINTLLGQPAGYWQHPEMAHEANGFSRFLLVRGWYAYLFTDLVIFSGLFRLVSILPRAWGLACIFYFILVNFIGASCWFFFQWRMGMEAPVIYGVLLAGVIVLLAFPSPDKNKSYI